MVNFDPLTAEIRWRVWGTQQILMGFTSWLHYCSDVAHRRSTKLCTIFSRLLGSTLYIHFGGLCPLMEFCQVQNSVCIQVLRSRILASLLHGTRAAGTKLSGVVQGMELRNFCRGCHLYSAGRPSHWASAHILVDHVSDVYKTTLHNTLFMTALRSRWGHYIFALWFLSFFPRLISAVADWISTILLHMVWP